MNSKRNFPSFISAFLDHSKNVGAPEKFLLWSAISGVAGALERKTWINFNNNQLIYPNLFVMLVAESGVARKTTASKQIMDILYKVKGMKFMPNQLSGASLIEHLKEAGDTKSIMVEGVQYKNSSLFAYSSEAINTIGKADNLHGIQELLTDFYDCGNIKGWSNEFGWDKTTFSRGKVVIYNPCLNFLGCSTPKWLNEAIGKTGIEGGFASRFLFINQTKRERGASGFVIEEEDQADKEESFNEAAKVTNMLIEDLSAINKLQGQFRLLKGVKQLFNDFLKENDKKSDEDGDMKAYYARKPWLCLKLSQILSAECSDEMIIAPIHFESARELLESIEKDMYLPFTGKNENKNYASFIKVWNVIRVKEVWQKQQIFGTCYNNANIPQIEEHLRVLSSMGKIKVVPTNGGVYYQVVDNTPLG